MYWGLRFAGTAMLLFGLLALQNLFKFAWSHIDVALYL